MVTSWFWSLPLEQRAWVCFGVGFVLFGLLLAVKVTSDVRYQARRDRAERAGQQVTELLAVVPADTVELRRLRTTDTVGGGGR